MYEIIHEPISVVGVYANARFMPKKFLWKTKEYLVSEITLVAEIKDGSVRKRHYTVICKGNAYRLLFDRAEETWMLEEVWCD